MSQDRRQARPARRQGSGDRLAVELYRAVLLEADRILRSRDLDEAQLEALGATIDAIHDALVGRA